MIRFYIMITASCCLMARFSFHVSQWVFSADFSVIDSQLALHLFDDFRFFYNVCQLVFQQVLGDPSKRPIGFYHLVSYFITFLYFKISKFTNNNFLSLSLLTVGTLITNFKQNLWLCSSVKSQSGEKAIMSPYSGHFPLSLVLLDDLIGKIIYGTLRVKTSPQRCKGRLGLAIR